MTRFSTFYDFIKFIKYPECQNIGYYCLDFKKITIEIHMDNMLI